MRICLVAVINRFSGKNDNRLDSICLICTLK